MNDGDMTHERAYRGSDYIEKLGSTKIIVLGLGALGSNIVESLTRIGASNIRGVDFDRVSAANLTTQAYSTADIGSLKAEATKNRVFRQTGVEIEAVSKELTVDNAHKMFKGANLVIDAFDNAASRQIVQDRSLGYSTLHCGVSGDGYGQVVWGNWYKVPKDNHDLPACDQPLARNLIMLVATVAVEEILDFCLASAPRVSNWEVTLRDLRIQLYR